jgi:uncharacterized repeat protein (TIGR01451 family)
MRSLTLTTCFLLLSIQLVTAQSQSVIWRKCFGGTAKDVANDILINNDGTMIVAGYSHSNDGNVTGHHGDATTSDGWITKLDTAGNLLWQKSVGGTANDYLNTVIATDDGGYLCTGYTYSNDGDVTGNHGMADVWAIKLDDNGTVVWSKCYGGSLIDTAMDAVRLHDGQFALIGTTNSTDGNVLSGTANNTAYDAWVIKLNKTNGNLMWERVINYGDSTFNNIWDQTSGDGGINIAESPTHSIMAYVSGAYLFTYWSSDQWNTRVENTGVLYQLNETTGNADFFAAAGGGWQNNMVMYKSNTGYNFMYDRTGFTTSPINCFSYSRIHLRLDFAGNQISKIVSSSSPCDDSHPAILESIISRPHGLIVSSAGKFINAGQKEVISPFDVFRYNIKPYISNIGAIANTDGSDIPDKFTAVKELAIGDEFIAVGLTSSGSFSIFTPNAPDFKGDLDFWVIKYQSLNTIKSNFYIDYNNNNIKDAGEPPFNRVVAKTINQNRITSVWAYPVNGVAETTVDTGTYKTTASLFRPYYAVSPDTATNIFTTYKNTVTINYPVHPIPGSRDYGVFLTAYSPLRPGFVTHNGIIYNNFGVDTLTNKKIRLVVNNHLHFSSSTPAPTSVVADTITWNIAQLQPDSSGFINLYLTADSIPEISLNDTLRLTAYIDNTGDVKPSDNISSILQGVSGSYDPNDKQENYGGSMPLTDAASGNYLTYTILFQNTGNDTAFNITVRDTLSSLLDSTSFEMINASHAYSVSIKDGRYVTWKFNNIKLLDSTHNEPLSHGYISYRIKPKLPIGIGDIITNKAAIYFDYNPPVITNTSATEIKGTPANTSWTGAVSTAWENPMNWSNGLVPDINTIVIIPAGVPNFPEINSNAFCYRISVMPSATVLVKTGFKLKVTAKN